MDNKLPPQNIDAEMSVLGAIFIDNACVSKVTALIDAMDFYKETHRTILKAMLSLNLTKSPIDLVTLTNSLKEAGDLEIIGGAAYLLLLVDFVPTAANVTYYCRIVKEASNKRQLIQHGQKLVALGYSGEPIAEGVKDAKAELAGISASKDSFGGVSVGDITTVDQRAKRYIDQAKTFDKSRFITGFPLLDAHIRGVAPGEVLTIIAEPGGFKTAWLQNLLLNKTRFPILEGGLFAD